MDWYCLYFFLKPKNLIKMYRYKEKGAKPLT